MRDHKSTTQPVVIVLAVLVLATFGYSQETKDNQAQPQLQSQSQAEQPCVILKRMGPADQVTSRMYSFGIRGKQFQFAEGTLPKGVKFHGRMTDHDVRKVQDAGGKVVVIGDHYTDEEIESARKTCR